MKLPDVNVLVNAVNEESAQHAAATQWINRSLTTGVVGFAWVALLGFLRVSTMRGVLTRPLAIPEALQTMREWIEHPHARLLAPGPPHADLLSRLLLVAGLAGNLTTDAHLAAIAIEHGATLASFDRNFERFAGLAFEHLS